MLGMLVLVLALLAPSRVLAEGAWRTSWAAPPAPAMAAVTAPVPRPATPTFENQTIVQVVRLSAGGRRLRLRASNEYGAMPLSVGHVTVAAWADGAVRTGSQREVTFAGARSARIAPHAPLVSDAIDLPVGPLASLQVSLFLPEASGPCSCHVAGLQPASVSPPGDYTDRSFTPAAKVEVRAFLTAVDVEGAAPALGVAAFGDSITDGWRSTSGANRRWPDLVAERLVQAHRDVAVANAGLSGNRVLSDGSVPAFGESALTRFDRDVLGQPGITHVIVLEGVNDLGGQPSPSPEALIAGYRQLIARAHDHGIKLILATVLPYEGAAYFRPEGETTRQAVNAWIRANREADGVIDFDAVMRDPKQPARLRADLQSGDWLHPNDAGYRAMGEAVPLAAIK